MQKNYMSKLILLVIVLTAQQALADKTSGLKWITLEKGLQFGEFKAKSESVLGDSIVRILRINPKYFSFHLANASAKGEGVNLSVRQWAKKYKFVASINASMYQRDHLRSISFMRSGAHVNNPRLSRHKTILAFNPIKSDDGKVKLFDRECDSIKQMKQDFHVLVQSIRMISCTGKNVWKQQKGKWSTAAIAADKDGNILFIHVRALYTTHDLINILIALPINIRSAMYVEGGPQAQLFIRGGEDKEFNLLGRYRLRLSQNIITKYGWPVPNVIGIKKR